MSWPTLNEPPVECIGFDKKYLPAVMSAIDNNLVEWQKGSLYVYECICKFKWADCLWEMSEFKECVVSIQLLKGQPNEKDLTYAILKGKIETS